MAEPDIANNVNRVVNVNHANNVNSVNSIRGVLRFVKKKRYQNSQKIIIQFPLIYSLCLLHISLDRIKWWLWWSGNGRGRDAGDGTLSDRSIWGARQAAAAPQPRWNAREKNWEIFFALALQTTSCICLGWIKPESRSKLFPGSRLGFNYAFVGLTTPHNGFRQRKWKGVNRKTWQDRAGSKHGAVWSSRRPPLINHLLSRWSFCSRSVSLSIRAAAGQ